ncbi:MAG: serine/threonine protein kinase [Deltaproteobacteria bacterium]|nr:serine/threonine protein kinase [Deltaproteobacteria bacterium]
MAGPQYTHFGRYRIVSELASGGMATVYRAALTGDSGFETTVALKVMHAHLARDEHHRRMFEDEARTGALLRHRGIIRTLDYGQEQSLPYIATELLEGRTLADALAPPRRRLPPDLAAWILCEMLDALAYAHALEDTDGRPLGIVHRDVSPQNLFLGRDGRVTLIDFGIALRQGRLERTRTGLVKGKFRYMAPEQASGEAMDGRTDIYSLALVVAAAISGKKPFADAGDTREMILRAQEGFTPPPALLRRVPAPFADLLSRMLARAPGDRPTALDALEEAQAVLGSEFPEAGPRALAEWLAAPADAAPRTATAAPEAPAASPRTPRKAPPAVDAPRPRRSPPPRPPAPSEPGVAPAWIFGGLAALFLLAMLWSSLGGA